MYGIWEAQILQTLQIFTEKKHRKPQQFALSPCSLSLLIPPYRALQDEDSSHPSYWLPFSGVDRSVQRDFQPYRRGSFQCLFREHFRGVMKFFPGSRSRIEGASNWVEAYGDVRRHTLLRRVLTRGFSDSERASQEALRRGLRRVLRRGSWKKGFREGACNALLETMNWEIVL